MDEHAARAIEVRAHGDVPVVLVHAVGHGVGERVLLRVDFAALDHGDPRLEIGRHRHRAKQLESLHVDVVGLEPDAHSFQVRARAHGPQPVGEVPEAVVPVAEHAVVDAAFDFLRQKRTERTV